VQIQQIWKPVESFMLKTLFVTTALATLLLAPASWAQQEHGPGVAPTGGESGVNGPAGGREAPGGKAPDNRMQSPSRSENAPGKASAPSKGERAEDKGLKPEPGAASRQESQSQEQREPRAASQGGREKGGARISSEQRTKLRTGFKGLQIREAANIAVANVRIGESIPHTVTEYWAPIPATILSIVPEWQDYRIVRVGGEYLVIDPETFEVVYIFT
jgi:hypothetical protein